ncbi:hypothetical protein E4680_12440 [Candidatus Macondimonas diazotrophica]|uniref:Uncharacterized protein n=2 Tax=Candidatus Macondimonas diazotrophica TaxID=2305248 RepID=A0A4Z0F697_9GAMM|nr:hypothetical protein E4680_12440 [Candidatus Macondimonas diazotrophica]
MLPLTDIKADRKIVDGVPSSWTISLGGEVLYTLPKHFSPAEVVLVKDAVIRVFNMYKDELEDKNSKERADSLTEINNKIRLLTEENHRLADMLENVLSD